MTDIYSVSLRRILPCLTYLRRFRALWGFSFFDYIFCILQLHVNLKIHPRIFNHHITIKAISLKDVILYDCNALWLLLILWRVLML